MRLGVVDDGQSTLPTVAPPAGRPDRRRPGQGRRRPAGPLRQVLPPDPGRPDRRVHHARQGRDGPPAQPARRSSTSARSAGSSRSSGRPSATQTYPIAIRVEAYDRTGLLSDITQVVAENKVNIVAASVSRDAGPHGRRHRHAPGPVGVAAGAGDEPDRGPQGRPERPARPGVGAAPGQLVPRRRATDRPVPPLDSVA